MKTKDTYEATFYLMYGASLTDIQAHKIPENKAKKKGYRVEWILVLDNVPDWAKRAWNDGYVYGPLVEFSKMRDKLKKWIKAKLH